MYTAVLVQQGWLLMTAAAVYIRSIIYTAAPVGTPGVLAVVGCLLQTCCETNGVLHSSACYLSCRCCREVLLYVRTAVKRASSTYNLYTATNSINQCTRSFHTHPQPTWLRKVVVVSAREQAAQQQQQHAETHTHTKTRAKHEQKVLHRS